MYLLHLYLNDQNLESNMSTIIKKKQMISHLLREKMSKKDCRYFSINYLLDFYIKKFQ